MAKLEKVGEGRNMRNTKESLSKAGVRDFASFKRNETLLKAFELNVL